MAAEGLRFGSETYRAGALERIEEARILLDAGRFALSLYVGGLAVEGMLRALCWTWNARLDEHHDLRAIALRVRNLGLLRQQDSELVAHVVDIARSWSNTLRYAGRDQLERLLVRRGVVRRKDLSRLRSFCEHYHLQCFELVERCERVWQHLRRRSSRKS